jgi:hypothetical protein
MFVEPELRITASPVTTCSAPSGMRRVMPVGKVLPPGGAGLPASAEGAGEALLWTGASDACGAGDSCAIVAAKMKASIMPFQRTCGGLR